MYPLLKVIIDLHHEKHGKTLSPKAMGFDHFLLENGQQKS